MKRREFLKSTLAGLTILTIPSIPLKERTLYVSEDVCSCDLIGKRMKFSNNCHQVLHIIREVNPITGKRIDYKDHRIPVADVNIHILKVQHDHYLCKSFFEDRLIYHLEYSHPIGTRLWTGELYIDTDDIVIVDALQNRRVIKDRGKIKIHQPIFVNKRSQEYYVDGELKTLTREEQMKSYYWSIEHFKKIGVKIYT